ncbi:hypothetical protein PEL8287_02068 [Roseovarius litorisediminis]|uniref:Uncharacterized protein n=1 Tax=Roseovarius litorisediminis TaxID=1312363 RepID=A0A1Y5SI78_9RHOB|nr:hypothetical protein PEL8287_02068 [Roseovarius litorisediminis]
MCLFWAAGSRAKSLLQHMFPHMPYAFSARLNLFGKNLIYLIYSSESPGCFVKFRPFLFGGPILAVSVSQGVGIAFFLVFVPLSC